MAVDRKKGLAALRKTLDDGAMSLLSEQRPREVVSTGIATLDAALGVGGLVRGSQNIFWGTPSSGKSALCYTAIGELMKRDKDAMACIFDIERSADMDWLVRFGIDPDRTVIIKEPTIEQAVNTFQEVMRSCSFDFIVIDSLGAVVRAVDFDGKDGKGGDATKAQVGGSSGVITRWVSKANSELIVLDKMENTGVEVIKPVIIHINQVRDNLSSMYGGHTMPGGHALQHMASVIVKVTASGAAADKLMGTSNGKKVQVGTRVSCNIEKNKFAPAKRLAGYDFCYEECPEHDFGIGSHLACLELAIEYEVVNARGAWCYYGTEGEEGFVKANGKAAMAELMKDNPEFYDRVYSETMARVSEENDEIMRDLEERRVKV